MIYFLHSYLPQPILFQIGFLKIHWYGVLVVLGIIAGLVVALKLAKRLGIKADKVYDLGFYLVIFGLLGGRLYAVLLDLPFYLGNPLEIFAVWHGGLAIHGAIIAGAVTLLIYFWWQKADFWQWADILAPALAIGQAIGRWGNYFNQELFGRPTDLVWGIPIALPNRPLDYLNFSYFQPTFFYESVLNLGNFFLLLFLFYWLRVKNQELRIKNQGSGLVVLIYLINYSLIRIAMESLRVDSAPVVLGLRWPVLVSFVLIVVSLLGIVYRFRK